MPNEAWSEVPERLCLPYLFEIYFSGSAWVEAHARQPVQEHVRLRDRLEIVDLL